MTYHFQTALNIHYKQIFEAIRFTLNCAFLVCNTYLVSCAFSFLKLYLYYMQEMHFVLPTAVFFNTALITVVLILCQKVKEWNVFVSESQFGIFPVPGWIFLNNISYKHMDV